MGSKILSASDWPKWSLLNTLSACIVQFFMLMGKIGEIINTLCRV
jgi:hypothetical protein